MIVFDILCGHKERKFMYPKDLCKLAENYCFPVAQVLDEVTLTDEFIQEVRNGKYSVDEGVVCKGNERAGNFVGGIWMCKIKTLAYLEKLKAFYGQDWERYWE